MSNWLDDVKEGWNKTANSKWYQSLRSDERISALKAFPESAFHPEVYKLILKQLHEVANKKVLLPSSGDNHAAFALSLLGADVTSTDISEKQLENAQEIAQKLNLNIRFVCQDTMKLNELPDDYFDLVYTSNGTHTWITDLDSMYKNITRVLKPNGCSIMYDIHPFNRPFVGEPWTEPKIKKSYFDAKTYRHWRVQDLINSMVNSGLAIKEMAELQAIDASFWFSYDDLKGQDKDKIKTINDWMSNPMAALPAWIAIVSQKIAI